jgi:peptide chain release factor 2
MLPSNASLTSGGSFDIDTKETELKALEEQSTAEDFWNDNEKAQGILKEVSKRRSWVDDWSNLDQEGRDLAELLEMAAEETETTDFSDELTALEEALGALEVRNMLGGEDDNRNALLTIHSGAGGTESQDWAEMLYRMYTRWIERKGFKGKVLDIQSAEEAGIKGATIEVNGDFAYGLLKAEAGVHRLVRISPFDSNARRHTSFASVFVYPEIDGDVDIEVNPKDLRIDTYRASGAGGQHVNKTDSAIRITHLPSGIVVQCQNERSQFKNKATAMKILMSRLYQAHLEEERAKKDSLNAEKKDIAWGSQIRSYVMHPYSMVKDHRTKVEMGDVNRVLEGDLDKFIEAFLLQKDILES